MELQHALLGLLTIRPMSGYDLKKAFTTTVDHFWHADQSQIYRTLGRLADAGLVTATVHQQDGKPDRKEHTLTDAGRAELSRWLTGPLEADQPKEPFLARLFFGGELGFTGVRELLDERERQLEASIEHLLGLPTGGDDLAALLRSATLHNGLGQARAEIAWLQDTRSRIAALEGAAS